MRSLDDNKLLIASPVSDFQSIPDQAIAAKMDKLDNELDIEKGK